MSIAAESPSTPRNSPGGGSSPKSHPGVTASGLPEPRILGESRVDRVTSMLMALVMGTALVVAWLALIAFLNSGFANQMTAPVELVEVFGGGGGTPDGQEGSIEKIDVPGAEAADRASNNEVAAADFEEPSLQEIPETVLDAVASSAADLAPSMPTGEVMATGERASRLGTGGPSLGDGPGDGGVAAHLRWSVVYGGGQTLEEYARQLDFMQIELGVIKEGRITYLSNFTQPTPTTRTGATDKRLYFLWQGDERKQSDIQLLKKAGFDPGDGHIFQFFSKATEDRLRNLEYQFKGLRPSEIRMTRFRVVPKGATYELEVVTQVPLRG